MSHQSNQQYLPLDIVLYIIDFVVPASNLPQLAVSPHQPTFRTILSLTLTSRALYPTAQRLLYTHCLYIHTPRRLHRLLDIISDSSDPSKPARDKEHLLPFMTSLYLRPFASHTTIEDLATATAVRNLLSILSPHLRRLLIDMPLRSCYPEDDILGIRPILRSAFTAMPVLEEFCSVRDELYLDSIVRVPQPGEPLVWSLWPNLKTLALYNVDVSDERFWEGMRLLEHVETVVLTRSDGLEDVDMKVEWRKQFDKDDRVKPLDVLLVNVEAEHKVVLGRDEWKEDDKMQVRELNVPISYYGDEDLIIICQQWVKRKIMRGEHVADWT